ncbi:DUF7594 domain-containing protein [Pedobacter sp.]|uniref:CBM96 family carbohydrate-binding protein n=1 Tax=Pedobacter sp. TaxID=1411316 RepID=UPI003D7F57DC
MKKINLYFRLLLVCSLAVTTISCGKFQLLKDTDSALVDAGTNLKTQTIRDFLIADHTSDHTTLDLFSAAVKRAGLLDMLGKNDEYSVVMLNNAAVSQLLSAIGYPTVEDVPPIILKNILSDLIIKGRIKSTDLALNETKKIETINGNFIYYSRTSTSSDQFVLYINQNSTLGSSAALVKSQDLDFNNGIAHVTGSFTFYKLLDEKSDEANPGGNTATQKIPVTKDVYIRGGTGNLNANFNDAATIDLKAVSTADATVGRIGLLQYPLPAPTFGDKIGSARMYVYVYNTGLTSATTFSFAAHLGENVDWSETAVTWTNAPKYNSIAMSTTPVAGATVGWVSFDVTSAVAELYANKASFINVFLRHNVDNFIKLRPREFSSGLYASYIMLTSPPLTLLTLGQVSTLKVSAQEGITSLSLDNLKMDGDADKNITYTVKQGPEAGYLVKYGIPLAANASFSQADLAKGAIKYLYGGTGSADRIVFQARDHNGGYFESDLNLDIAIN